MKEAELLVPGETEEDISDMHPMGFFNRYSFAKVSAINNNSFSQTNKSKSFVFSVFERLGGASISGSIYNLSATAIGAGVLALPFVMKIAGYGLGMILLLGGALTSIWSLYMLLETARVVKAKNFMVVCVRAGGKPLGIMLELSIQFHLIGLLIIYQIICTSLANAFMGQIGISNAFITNIYQNKLQPIVLLVIIFPLCILKQLSSLSYASLLSICTIAYTAIVLIIEMPFYWKQNYGTDDIQMQWFILDWEILDAFSMTFLAYSCQQTFFSVYDELSKNTSTRMRKVIHISIVLNVILYAVIASAGYLSTFNNTKQLVIERDKLKNFFWDRDYFMIFAILGVFLTVLISIPINYSALRRSFYNLFFSPDEPIRNPKNIYFTVIVLSITTTIAIIFPKIQSMFSIIGGLCAVLTCFLIPALAYILGTPGNFWRWNKLLSGLLCLIFCILGLGSVIFTIYNIIIGKAK